MVRISLQQILRIWNEKRNFGGIKSEILPMHILIIFLSIQCYSDLRSDTENQFLIDPFFNNVRQPTIYETLIDIYEKTNNNSKNLRILACACLKKYEDCRGGKNSHYVRENTKCTINRDDCITLLNELDLPQHIKDSVLKSFISQ